MSSPIKTGQRVQLSDEAMILGIRRKRVKGVVSGFSRDGVMVHVLVDGNKMTQTYARQFWEVLAEESPAAQLGRRGGLKTARRGPEYYREIASKRRTFGGGRPKRDNTGGAGR